MDVVNEYLKRFEVVKSYGRYEYRKIAPRMVCRDGFTMSVQASDRHLCSPRKRVGPYDAVEVCFPSAEEPLLLPYAEDAAAYADTIYGKVPVAVVSTVIEKHGGLRE